MKNKKFSNLFAAVSLISGVLWFGFYLTRLILTYNLFEEGELVLKNFINNSSISGIFQSFEPLYYLTFVTYIILIICFTLFLVSSRLKLKENGWLFIITIIIYFTLPFEAILMAVDYRLILMHIAHNFNSDLALTLTIDRLENLGGFSVIIILCYFSIPYFLIFKPFSAIKDK
ncbi:MAG: hypothetical protein KJN64_05245 [Ignavibacteria bacterium]|nr:hypothetical protein [Ignavibacteria bacterium]MBT8381689.1 hypothetical protein [Ignavibacteria bacterium]MBT8390310.1 hypothetical protein [Ignavibacteria bacterium]NNL20281.1 hypothetical protein [Ignavibacteriaceae bacterium]